MDIVLGEPLGIETFCDRLSDALEEPFEIARVLLDEGFEGLDIIWSEDAGPFEFSVSSS